MFLVTRAPLLLGPTEQLIKILRLAGITLPPVGFGVNHYYWCLVTTLPLSRESGWTF